MKKLMELFSNFYVLYERRYLQLLKVSTPYPTFPLCAPRRSIKVCTMIDVAPSTEALLRFFEKQLFASNDENERSSGKALGKIENFMVFVLAASVFTAHSN